MKYQHYNIEDYLADPYFIDWIRHPVAEKNAFWEEWMRIHPEHREKIFQARELLLSMQFHHLEPGEEEYQDVLSHVLQGQKSQYYERQQKTGYRDWRPDIAVFLKRVAVLLLCIAGAVIWLKVGNRQAAVSEEIQPVYFVKQNPKGQRSIIKLPDGSDVVLNAESKISYQEGFGGNVREVVLSGEAYFEVARDTLKPFIVEAAGVYTKALGTSFNIKAYEQERSVEVSLTSGKVEVGDSILTKQNKKLLLQPGEKAIYTTGSHNFQKEKVDYHLDIAWKEGIISFEDAGFKEVARCLERWYDVEFIVTEGPFEPWHYDGVFKNSNLERVLERLAYVQNFTYAVKGRKVYINFKK